MIYWLIILKRMLEDLLILPFVLAGRMKAKKLPLEKQYEIFFFFPFYHTGGAEKVHSLIAHALRDKKALIVFTRRSVDDVFMQAFHQAGHDIMDISAFTDDKSRYWNNLVYRGIFSYHINQQSTPSVVFNGQSNFGYKLSRWINKNIPQIELIHSFSSFSYIRVPFLPYYRETVMISMNRIQDHLDMYRRWGVPSRYAVRIRYILNGIELPLTRPEPREPEDQLKIMYVGRGTPEKRVHLAAAISGRLRQQNMPVEMSYIGDNANAIPEEERRYGVYYGTVDDPLVLHNLYLHRADVLLVTSSEEGFPLVIMEAMARGSVILATPVGDIPIHVQQGVNGFLFSSIKDEQLITKEAEAYVAKLIEDPALLTRISANNIEYAYGNFGLHNFESRYQQLIESYLT
jgi:glycosyltransferase involved in cell wall biosynthesis